MSGYYIGHKRKLVIWQAQFLDFCSFLCLQMIYPKVKIQVENVWQKIRHFFLVFCNTAVTVKILSDDLTNISLWVHK